MPVAVALEDVEGTLVSRELEGGTLHRRSFIETGEAGSPQAFIVQYGPNPLHLVYWLLAAAYPERFAAVAPIAGHIVPIPLPRLKNLPLWVFHGDADERAPVIETCRTVEALEAIGANVKLTIYPGVGHDSWTQTYNNPALYDWFLSQKRS